MVQQVNQTATMHLDTNQYWYREMPNRIALCNRIVKAEHTVKDKSGVTCGICRYHLR